MGEKLTRKYGLFTAIAMVVGVVIGSGVFFKAQDILNYTNGSMQLGIIAWLIGAAVMIVCAYSFSVMAAKYEKVNGVVDYAEATCGKKYAYIIAWFLSTIYYPAMTSVLAWVSARFTCVIMGIENPLASTECFVLAAFYLIASFAMNSIAPKVAGKFQVSSTIIKLIPILLMVVGGVIVGLVNGNLSDSFSHTVTTGTEISVGTSLFKAVSAAAFAYEGWIIATSINAELHNSKRNLPIALVVGTAIVAAIYILYFVGVSGGASVDVLMKDGASKAFINLFGQFGGTLLNVFVVISCLGTLNGLTLACSRGFYSVSQRAGEGKIQLLSEVSNTGMPVNSAIVALFVTAAWLVYWYGGITRAVFLGVNSWWGAITFDSSELPIITIYALYIPIFIMMIIKEKDLGVIKRIIMPVLSVLASVFMVVVAAMAHGISALWYLAVFAIIVVIGILFMGKEKSK